MKIITHLKPKERKLMQEKIDTLIACRKVEIEIFENNIMKPLRNSVEILMDARKGRQSIDAMVYHNRAITRHIRRFFESGGQYREGAK